MEWFERLTGFAETSYNETRSRLVVEGQKLRSLVNGRSFAIGRLEVVALQELRERVSVRKAAGDVTKQRRAVVGGDGIVLRCSAIARLGGDASHDAHGAA